MLVSVFESGVHEKPIFPKAFQASTSAVRASLGGESGALSSPWKYEFGIGGDAISCCLGGLTPVSSESIFYHVLNSSPTPAQPISMQLWANYETHIFKKWGKYLKTPRGSASG